MSDPSPDRRRWLFFGLSLVIGVATALVLVVSVAGIRDRLGFDRVFRRIDQMIRTERYDAEYTRAITEAADFARTRRQFSDLARLAWRLDTDDRWSLLIAVSARAQDRLRRHDDFRRIEAYSLVRLGQRSRGVELVEDDRDRMSLRIAMLGLIDREQAEDSRQRLVSRGLSEDAPALFSTVSRAFVDDSAEAAWEAWEATQASAFAVNSALYAAAANDRDSTLRATDPLRALGDSDEPLQTLYLAAWLDDDEWLFRQLRSLEARQVVETEVFLIQADGHLRQGQLREARAIYREIAATDPGADVIPFINDAVITERFDDGLVDPIYERAINAHPDSSRLRLAWGSRLLRTGRRLDAALAIAPLTSDQTDEETWILVRAILGRRRPVDRLVADLWNYLNEYPDSHSVAAFLANLLYVREDWESIYVLLARYPPTAAPWARVLHALRADREGNFVVADELLAEARALEVLYNRAVFSLRRHDREIVRASIDDYASMVQRDVAAGSPPRPLPDVSVLLLEAEAAYQDNQFGQALTYLERAVALGYPPRRVERYRALLAAER